MKVDEWHMYGSARLGVYEANRTISKRIARDLNNDNQITNNEYVIETPEEVLYLYASYQLERGAKRYELANHLGNVLTVISDKKTANFTGTTFTNFTAERISATDYSPFGAPLAGRTWNGGEYRFGFGAMEQDDEVVGEGNAYTTYFRELDPRLGRWMSIDPKLNAWENPYASMGNNPIYYNDVLGDKIGKGKQHFDNYNKSVDARIKSTQSDISNIDGKLKGLDPNSKRAGNLNAEKSSLLTKMTELTNIKSELTAMEQDQNTTFNFNEQDGADGSFTYDGATGEFNINFGTEDYYGSMAHESKHGYQLLTGKLSFVHPGGARGTIHDAEDEAEAYSRHFFISPNGPTAKKWYKKFGSLDVTVDRVLKWDNGHYSGLPAVQLTTSSTISQINAA